MVLAALAAAPSLNEARADDAAAPAVVAIEPAQRDADKPLPAVRAFGRGPSAQADAEGATRTDTPTREVPQAVRVVTRPWLDDFGALRLDDVLDHVAGVSRQNKFGGLWDNVSIRGFAGHEDQGMSLLRNGIAANRGFNAPRDTANVERIEFLKGTMGALYGSSEPGGTVNVVTKQPSFKAANALEAWLGSHDFRRMAFDSTGPIDGGADTPATLAYRLNLAVEDKDSFRDHVHSRRELVAPAFAWKLGADTLLRYDGEWLRQRAPLDRGVVAVSGQLGVVPDSRFYGEPADGDTAIDNQTHQLFIEQVLSTEWRWRAALQRKLGTLDGLASESHPYGPSPCPVSVETQGILCRQLRQRDFASNETSAQFDLVGRFDTAGLQHELLVGAEASRYRLDQRLLQAPGGARYGYGIDVFEPVYGATRPALTVTAIDRGVVERSEAVYVQDQVSLSPSWKLLAGLRHDRFRGHIDDRTRQATEQSPSATSPRLGITWLPSDELSVYASTGRSFRPQTNTDAAGRTLAPETGTSREVGAKWQARDGSLAASLALFDIAKRDVTTYDADGTYLVAVPGKVRNRGIEAEVAGWVAPAWRVALNYAFLDADASLPNIARHSGSAFVVHETALDAGGVIGLGGGATHVGERRGDSGEPVLPAYTVARLTAYWNVSRPLRLSFDIDNVFDRRYYTDAYNRVWVTPGTPRQFLVGAQYRF